MSIVITWKISKIKVQGQVISTLLLGINFWKWKQTDENEVLNIVQRAR